MSAQSARSGAGDHARKLRIGYSGLFLAEPHTGTGRYARRVLEQFAQVSAVETVVVCDRSARDLYPAGESERPRVRMVRAPRGSQHVPQSIAKVLWEQAALPLAATRVGIDVLYSPHFSTPLAIRIPTVVSIHDVIPLTESAYAGSRFWRAYFTLTAAAARRAAAVITLSQFAAADIERLLGIPRTKIHVVYPGTESAFRPPDNATALLEVRERLRLPDQYLLYVGGAVAHKNIGLLFHALLALRERLGSTLHASVPPLVVAAQVPKPGAGPSYPDWRGQAEALDMGGLVQFIERIPEQDLPAVYAGATAFLFPSRNEGFGLTPLEAMACGTPVVCSCAASLPEAVGDAAVLVPPDDAEAWASAILSVCNDEGRRHILRESGMRRAASFRWEDTANQVLAIIQEAAHCAS